MKTKTFIEAFIVLAILTFLIYFGYDSFKLDEACKAKGGVLYRGSCIKVDVIK